MCPQMTRVGMLGMTYLDVPSPAPPLPPPIPPPPNPRPYGKIHNYMTTNGS